MISSFRIRLIVGIVGVFIFQYSLITSLLCLSFVMMSASLRLINSSHPTSFFQSFIAFFTGVSFFTLVIILVLSSFNLFLAALDKEPYEYSFINGQWDGMLFLSFIFFLIISNTIICATHLFFQFYHSEFEMNDQFKSQTIFMTGGTSGIGKIAALHALENGAHLILLARNLEKGEDLRLNFQNNFQGSTGKLTLIKGDLSSFRSIMRACEAVEKLDVKIDQLILNAGLMNFERKLSKDRIEETLQVNLLSPLLLLDTLHKLMSKDGRSKIIITASAYHKGTIQFDDIEFEENYKPLAAYAQSKLGTILLSKLLSEKLEKISIYTQHPGIVNTAITRDANKFMRFFFRIIGSSPTTGAKTLIHLMENKNSSLVNGAYYAKEVPGKTTKESKDMTVAKALMRKCISYLAPYLDDEKSII